MSGSMLPAWRSVAVVVAHPDDESFGLGAVIDAFARSGAVVSVLCFTKGEASTLGAEFEDLGRIRSDELGDAARALGVARVELLGFPDGALSDVCDSVLASEVLRHLDASTPDGILVFDPSGVTGHPDHQTATAAAIIAASSRGIPVVAWALPSDVAAVLSAETGATFTGCEADELDLRIAVDRRAQRRAVSCHPSQAVPGSALWHRLELLGDSEYLMWLQRSEPSCGGA